MTTTAGPATDAGWLWSELGLVAEVTTDIDGGGLDALVGLALRRNPRRAHLLVSRVLGKHLPVDPATALAAGARLAAQVRRLPGLTALGPAAAGQGAVEDGPLVIGYCETATALGHAVADGLPGSHYLHTTRRDTPGVPPVLEFTESHSHASFHWLVPRDPAILHDTRPIVLVDDELSTGRTALGTIRSLHAHAPRGHYVVAALVDARPALAQVAFAELAAELAVRIDVVSLIAATVAVPPDIAERAARIRARFAPLPPDADPDAGSSPGSGRESESGLALGSSSPVRRLSASWPADLPDGGRFGWSSRDGRRLDALLDPLAATVRAALIVPSGRTLVLGTEEFMYVPMRIARALARGGAGDVRYQSTTRSPVHPLDADGCAIRSALTFPAPDDPRRVSHVYNVRPGRYDDIVVIVDAGVDASAPIPVADPSGLVAQLRAHAPVTVLTIAAQPPAPRPAAPPPPPAAARPTGPDTAATSADGGLPLRGQNASMTTPVRTIGSGSYDPADVTFLLTDLSDVDLERPTEDREEAMQAGRHYSEDLPVEYQPDDSYLRLYHQALERSARRVALATGVVAELVRVTKPEPVLVSIARAGTPVGILMRRWYVFRHGLDVPHHAISVIKDRGVDMNAVRHLTDRFDRAALQFVDGWTGKGVMTRVLTEALAGLGLDDTLAVLADPARCVSLYGTRDDFLIPSACLNSTVSGLVSRTVLNAEHIGPDDFHGAKFYRDLAPHDLSRHFIETVAAQFDAVADEVDAAWPALWAADRTPTWEGWAAVERIAADYDIPDVVMVKPGVGEATRVLLRRVPWRILVAPDRLDELAHVLALAADRGVPVEERADLPFSCVGLVRPLGATPTFHTPGARWRPPTT
ncbi:phosphoribosyltransferase [Candidatus Frankia nodulisporulans]|uniref:phosphoribosyltransferase n=4 Tax=Candidatus Frankia nodulisporulans TaxID=2060052 RepID=UPI0015840700